MNESVGIRIEDRINAQSDGGLQIEDGFVTCVLRDEASHNPTQHGTKQRTESGETTRNCAILAISLIR